MNNHRGFVSEDTFASARHLQVSTDTLRLQRYVPTESMQMSGSGVGHLRTLFDSARRNLEVGGVAHIALGLNPRGTNTGTTGHVLLLQRLPRERYALFDPNNGVMTYSNRRAMEAGLRRYMDESFRDTGMQLTPDSVQYYAFSPTSGQMAGPSGSREAPDRPQARPEPPLTPSAQGESPARDALASRCDQSNSLSIDMLSGAAGQREAMSGMDRGVAAAALRDIAQGHAPNLTDATENVRRGLADPARRQMTLNRVFDLQQQNGAGVVEPLPGYARRRGAAGMASAANLIGDLRQHFGSLHVNDNMGAGYPTDLAIIDLSMSRQPQGNPDHADARTDSVPIVVQRLHEMDDFEGDQYELYDPGSGVYRYNTFGEMADALRGVFDVGFRPLGGVDHADTTYYANLARPVAATGGPAHPPASSVISNLDLAGVERRLGIINARPGVTPSPGLPPPPFVIEPKQELKRSAPFSPTLKPDGLFRPSMLSPVRLKGHGGFDSERTPVSDINLSIHNLDVASHPRLVDSAGYLGTFRKEKTALERLPGDAAIGYIYFVAPTPNMVDVAGSLGREEHAPENGEVAAMGWIDYPQIRGWRAVKNGVPGKYVANPDYRWDVYDQTRMAGSQPQLSRLPINNDVWREEGFKASVSRVGNAYGKEREALQFNEDPNLTHALFYDAAWEKVRELNRRQSEGLDYRGPLRLRAYGAADRSKTEIYVDPDNNVQVNTLNSRSSWKKGTRRNFSFADDGRFHLIDDYNKVLRVGSNDYLYLGDVPDAASLNGVFEYDGKHLIHQEDLRLLTTGLSSYTPFVDNDTHGERSEWHLRTSGGREVTPPRVNLHTFRSQTSGNPQQLYAFYQDPDMALPSGVTRFVTRVPNNPFGGKFLDYVGRITDEEARNAADFLRKQNAAWLFDDGFYAVAKGPDVMEVSRLDGTPVWRAEGVNVEPNRISTVTFKPLLPLSSNYRMADETKKRVEAREDRRRDVIALLTQSKSTPASRTTV
ncbi:enterotoxin A family protein [Paraburkholderia sp. 2C]